MQAIKFLTSKMQIIMPISREFIHFNFLFLIIMIMEQFFLNKYLYAKRSCMGGGDINDKNVLLNITVLYEHKSCTLFPQLCCLSLTWFVNCLHNMYYAVLYLLFI